MLMTGLIKDVIYVYRTGFAIWFWHAPESGQRGPRIEVISDMELTDVRRMIEYE